MTQAGNESHHPAIVCTNNRNKVNELLNLLPSFRLEPLPSGVALPPEDGETFTDNALIKARAGHTLFPNHWIIADDSGLIVDALNGDPGVRSARFAGDTATDKDNVRLLLERLNELGLPFSKTSSSARFVTVIAAITPSGQELIAEGTVEGHIIPETRGDGGFGYDPVFVPEGFEQTFAQLPAETKNEISHRANAAKRLEGLLTKHVL